MRTIHMALVLPLTLFVLAAFGCGRSDVGDDSAETGSPPAAAPVTEAPVMDAPDESAPDTPPATAHNPPEPRVEFVFQIGQANVDRAGTDAAVSLVQDTLDGRAFPAQVQAVYPDQVRVTVLLDAFEGSRTTSVVALYHHILCPPPLTFRIAVDPANDPPEPKRLAQLRDELRSSGRLDFPDYVWRPLRDPADFFGSQWQDLIDAEPDVIIAACAARQVVGTSMNARIFVLFPTDEKQILAVGEEIKDARALLSIDPMGRPALAINLDATGAQAMKQFSSANVGRLLAIVFDGDILTMPRIRGEMGAKLMLSGDFTRDDREALITAFISDPAIRALKLTPIQHHIYDADKTGQ